ncbi:MAG: hypothetical protein OEM81_00435 [Acidimicrobiia bacterium]|nr:hypothetical protein [Acidimicrobiia bacterium]MDH3396277.1 hypothetical protein [Acidimicrobiia bacterium]
MTEIPTSMRAVVFDAPGPPEALQIREVRGAYFGDSHTNVGWEIITRPYGSGPKGEPSDMNETSPVQLERELGR